MFNIMLDRFPDSYAGHLIRTDYRIGIQIILCLSDVEYSEYERMAIACGLLFGQGVPEQEKALEGLYWFMLCGKEPSEATHEEEVYCDYDYDSSLIASAYRKAYGIDLATTKMHWFEFNALMADLGECAFTQTIQIRKKKLNSDMSTEELNYYADAKRLVALPKKYNAEEREKINAFLMAHYGGE